MPDRTTALIDIYASTTSPDAFSLSPDGSTVAFTLAINGYAQIHTMPTAGPAYPRRLTAALANCTGPQWSPDGWRIVFVHDKAIWTMNADGSDARELTDHPAGNSDPRWSPDGSRIAFYSRRRGWEQLWVVAAEGGTPQQVTVGAFDQSDVVWSPDSRRLAFCSVRDDDLTTRGIYLVSAVGGAECLISPRGGWSGAPHFSRDGRTIAFLSDHDGWFHVYAYDCVTDSTRQLTCGDFEDGGPHFYSVDPRGGPLFSPDGRQLAFLRHREGNFDIWVIDVQSGAARCVSQRDGLAHLIGWLPDGEHLLLSHESLPRPVELQVLSTQGSVRTLIDPSVTEQRSDAMILPEWVTYPARDGTTIHAALLRAPAPPEPQNSKAAPAVIFLHGGPSFQFANYYYPLPELLAQAGYVVLAPNFRGSTGYGKNFRQGNFGEWGHADAFDAIDAAHWLQAQPFVDTKRIAVMGPSYGGYLTLAALTLEPGLFCAGIDMYGDSEIAESYRHGDR